MCRVEVLSSSGIPEYPFSVLNVSIKIGWHINVGIISWPVKPFWSEVSSQYVKNSAQILEKNDNRIISDQKCQITISNALYLGLLTRVLLIKIGISGRTSNPKCNFGHWSKMILKSNSYLLTKLQNQLTKNGQNFSKKCFKCFKIWSFQKMSITKNVPQN